MSPSPSKHPQKAKVFGTDRLRKALGLLLAFRCDRPTASVDELARELQIPKSSAYRYALLLREVGLLESNGDRLQVAPVAIDLAKAAIVANDIIQIAHPVLQSMRDQTLESARLTRRLNDSSVCIDEVECGQPVRLTYSVGQPKPLYGGAAAKTLLAFMENADFADYLGRIHKLLPNKEKRSALLAELPKIRARGWATSEGEVNSGVWGAAAPVSNGKTVIAVVSVACPAYRLTKTKKGRILKVVRNGAAAISARLSTMHS